MNPTTLLITPQRLASRVGVPADWLCKEADAGRLPHLRVGWRIYFDADVIARLLRERAASVPAFAPEEVEQ